MTLEYLINVETSIWGTRKRSRWRGNQLR